MVRAVRFDSNLCPTVVADSEEEAARALREVEEFLLGKRRTFSVAADIVNQGTAFQRRVWRALLDIPYGEVRTYGDIAETIGDGKAVRAVGGACNKNPIPLIVPCHRVVGSGGKLTGFALGLDFKQRLLEMERKNK